MKTKWMLLMGILVLAMFVGVSMADDQDRDRDRLQDRICEDCGDCDRDGDGWCDWCCYDFLYDEDGESDPPQDGTGKQNGQGDDNGHNGKQDDPDQDGTGDGNQNGHDEDN